MILDNLVWRSDSALWEVLKKYGNVPTVEEVIMIIMALLLLVMVMTLMIMVMMW